MKQPGSTAPSPETVLPEINLDTYYERLRGEQALPSPRVHHFRRRTAQTEKPKPTITSGTRFTEAKTTA